MKIVHDSAIKPSAASSAPRLDPARGEAPNPDQQQTGTTRPAVRGRPNTTRLEVTTAIGHSRARAPPSDGRAVGLAQALHQDDGPGPERKHSSCGTQPVPMRSAVPTG